jgi:hypothetical protein
MRQRFFLLALLSCLVTPASAQNSGPTLEKCTCHFDQNGPADKEGALAANATLCVQTLDTGRRWCDITIHCLRGNMGPNCPAATNPKHALYSLYQSHVQDVVEAGGPAVAAFANMAESNGQAVNVAAKDADKELTACSDAYLSKGDKSASGIKGGFSCAYDGQSRWLTLTFSQGKELVRFLFGPSE